MAKSGWSLEEDRKMLMALTITGMDNPVRWNKAAETVGNKSSEACRQRYQKERKSFLTEYDLTKGDATTAAVKAGPKTRRKRQAGDVEDEDGSEEQQVVTKKIKAAPKGKGKKRGAKVKSEERVCDADEGADADNDQTVEPEEPASPVDTPIGKSKKATTKKKPAAAKGKAAAKKAKEGIDEDAADNIMEEFTKKEIEDEDAGADADDIDQDLTDLADPATPGCEAGINSELQFHKTEG